MFNSPRSPRLPTHRDRRGYQLIIEASWLDRSLGDMQVCSLLQVIRYQVTSITWRSRQRRDVNTQSLETVSMVRFQHNIIKQYNLENWEKVVKK